MKSFWVSLVLFLLVIAGIAGNIVYIRHCADYMKNAAERVLLDEIPPFGFVGFTLKKAER